MKKKLFIPVIALIILSLDQIIKIIIINNVQKYMGIEIIKNFFYIVNVKNIGGAWSILSGYVPILIILGIIVLGTLSYMIVKENNIKKIDVAIYGILIGGILGNLIDRIFRTYVIDYLDFKIFGYDFPVFNFADMCIVSAVFLLVIMIIRGEKHEISSK